MITREELIGLIEDLGEYLDFICDDEQAVAPLLARSTSAIAALQAAEPDVILDYEFDDDDAPDARGDLVFHWTGRGEFPAGTEFYAQLPCPPAKAQVPDGVNAELIAEILSDYADLQQSGVIASAGRYSPADAMEQADLLLTTSPAPDLKPT